VSEPEALTYLSSSLHTVLTEGHRLGSKSFRDPQMAAYLTALDLIHIGAGPDLAIDIISKHVLGQQLAPDELVETVHKAVTTAHYEHTQIVSVTCVDKRPLPGRLVGGAKMRMTLTMEIADGVTRDVLYVAQLGDGSVAGEWRQVAAAFDLALNERAPWDLSLIGRQAGAVLVLKACWVIQRLLRLPQ